MAKPSFINLWNEYLKIWSEYPDGKVCDGPWPNQCAIRMSYVLNADKTIKVNKATYTEPKCAHAHARGAESLANWLWKHHLGRPLIIGGSAQERLKLADKSGLIFFKDCFQQAGQTAALLQAVTMTRGTWPGRSGSGSWHEQAPAYTLTAARHADQSLCMCRIDSAACCRL